MFEVGATVSHSDRTVVDRPALHGQVVCHGGDTFGVSPLSWASSKVVESSSGCSLAGPPSTCSLAGPPSTRAYRIKRLSVVVVCSTAKLSWKASVARVRVPQPAAIRERRHVHRHQPATTAHAGTRRVPLDRRGCRGSMTTAHRISGSHKQTHKVLCAEHRLTAADRRGLTRVRWGRCQRSVPFCLPSHRAIAGRAAVVASQARHSLCRVHCPSPKSWQAR